MKKYLLTAVSIIAILSSCSETYNDIPQIDQNDPIKLEVTINNNASNLSSKVIEANRLLKVNNLPESTLKSATDEIEIDYSKNYTFTLRAEVEAPRVGGEYIQATHVKIADKLAFVSYNTQGEKFRGGVHVFDITDPNTPVLISEALFSNVDVSAVDYYQNVIYLAGAIDPQSEMYTLNSPAVLITLNLDDSKQISSISNLVDISSFVATDVEIDNDFVYVTSGSAGSLTTLNRNDLSVVNYIPLEDVRSLSVNTNNIYALSANQSIYSFTKNDFTEVENIFVQGPISNESKTEIDATDKYILAALNKSGLEIHMTDGSLKERFDRPVTAEGGADEDYVTNSVSLNEELLLIGNGAAGVYVGAMIPENNDDVSLLGNMDFGSSVNFVESQGNYIFVAAGAGGLKIITIDYDEGLPDDIIPTKPCETLVDNIIAMFPDKKNNKEKYPDLFKDENNVTLRLIKESPVYLTFVDEGAGYRNSLAYYSYNADNPPSSEDDIELHMLFPNVSKEGSGGALKTGDRVQLGDTPFAENTVIGFCLIVTGWKNGSTMDGAYRLYTNYEWNNNEDKQHVLFKEKNCKDLVLCFEDIRLPKGDIDFNDIIFTVNDNEEDANVATAFDLTNIVEM